MAGEGKSPRIRFPTVEVFSTLQGDIGATHERPLLPQEKQLARGIFGQSIDLDAVRIVTTPVVNAPTTLGNCIRVGGSGMPDWVLIHELAHVWQFQNKGTSYISDSAWHQTAAWVSSGLKSRAAAYQVTIQPGKSIHDYTAEQQATIIEQYFVVRGIRSNPEYQRMIKEVRASRPLPQNVRLQLALEEAAFGASAATRRLMPPQECGNAGVPLLRIEF
jgi:hypothetical protein